MKRNRKKTTLHFTSTQAFLAVFVVFGFLPWFGFCVLSMKNDQVSKQIKLLERDKKTYEQSLIRERSAWNMLNQPKQLEAAIAGAGLAMKVPTPDRSIHVASNGSMRADPALLRMIAASKKEREHTPSVVAANGTSRRSSRRR